MKQIKIIEIKTTDDYLLCSNKSCMKNAKAQIWVNGEITFLCKKCLSILGFNIGRKYIKDKTKQIKLTDLGFECSHKKIYDYTEKFKKFIKEVK